MQVAQAVLCKTSDCSRDLVRLAEIAPNLILAFASVECIPLAAAHLAEAFPSACRVGCSTAGEISNEGVSNARCVVTAVRFDKTHMVEVVTRLASMEDSLSAGRRLGDQLPKAGLRAVWLIGQGVSINGSALVAGLTEILGTSVPVTGGLAGDDGLFRQTWVLTSGGVDDRVVVALGLYGDHLVFNHGSFGGWKPFGPARKVTRCSGNVLFELDGEPALAIYKRYLGDYATGLPASGLLFPFSMLGRNHDEIGLIRTILGVNEDDGSLTLAGEIDPDGHLKLMRSSTDALVGGAETAAEAALGSEPVDGDGLALLVSCVGRKLVMGERVDEEVEAVADIFGRQIARAGFYSYGEICPSHSGDECRLHNQTMTITYLAER